MTSTDVAAAPTAAPHKSRYFSLSRVVAVMAKEFIQMRRDRLTFAMIIGVPVLQLVLFGYAINTDPKHLPTAMIVADYGPIERSIVAAMQTSGYFDIDGVAETEASAREQLARGDVSYIVTIPAGFQRALVRGERPQLLVEADATDPAATANALGALNEIVRGALARETVGPLARLAPGTLPVDVIIHRRYNPEGVTSYNIVPGLLGVILTMTTILMTSLALTREVERGTIENLLAMPARPYEIMAGKIVPYIGFGFVQVAVILVASQLLFNVPMAGSLLLLLAATLLFIATNVTLGYTISTVARSQMQAMQMTFFVFLPSILLSGFMFPFRGMPGWAQVIGEAIPLTHFLRVVRGIMLKGANFAEIWPNVWPLAAIWAVLATVALLRYRRTLD
jgi:ABC-2 type transport system permease protein